MRNPVRSFCLLALLAAPLAGCDSIARNPLALGASQRGVAAPVPSGATPAPAASQPLARARSLFAAGNFGLSADAYRSAVEAGPANAEAWIGLAAAYDELGRFDLADRAYGQALKITGPTAQLLNNRGYSLLLRGDYSAARRDLLAARAKDPEDRQIARNLQLLPR